MRAARSLLPVLFAVAFLLVSGTSVRGEDVKEDDAIRAASEGRISGLLRDLRHGDDAAREAAAREIRARARFSLPYVLAAAESTSDLEWRARCLDVAGRLERGLPSGARLHAGELVEFPSFEEGATGSVRERRRKALESAPPQPDLAAAERLREAERYADAVECIRLFAVAHPDRLVDALEAAASRDYHDDPAAHAGLFAVARLANERAPSLTGDEQARIALALAGWYTKDRQKALERLTKAYAGTPAALLAEVRLISSYSKNAEEETERFEALAQAHPGTEAARLALQHAAFHYSTTNLTTKFPDPLERFRRLAGIAVRLQGPEFPGPDGSLAAVRYLNEFFVSSRDLPESSAKALLDAYRCFFRNHFLLDVLAGEGSTVGYTLPAKLERLLEATGVEKERVPAAVQGELVQLELKLADSAGIQYLAAERAAMAGDLDAAYPELSMIQLEVPGTLYARKALAASAGLRYRQGDFTGAETLYARYLAQHPTSSFACLAALRIGHCRQMREAWSEAIHAYESASERYGTDQPVLAILAPVHLARCYEATGQIEEAIAAWRRALGAATGSEDPGASTAQTGFPGPRPEGRPDQHVAMIEVRERLALLERSRTHPAAVQRYVLGETLRDRGDHQRALKVWGEFLAQHPDAPVADEARWGVAQIWLGRALKIAKRGEGKESETVALAVVAEAEKAGSRFGNFAAALVRAAIDLRMDAKEAAKAKMAAAIKKWEETQVYDAPEDGVEADVAAARAAAFQPGAPDYRVRSGDWPHRVICSTIAVVEADGTSELLDLAPRLEHFPTVLYFTDVELFELGTYIDMLGAGEGPGDADQIAALLEEFFPVCAGHWGGWHLDSFPSFSEIRFEDEKRTAATLQFRVRYQGGDALVKRVNGGWKLADVGYRWIE